jgi:hypothetical protein
MTAEVKDLVTMYFERENAMQTLWQIYVAIIIGLLAFLGAIPSAVKKLYIPFVLTIGFVAFAAVNGDAIYDVAHTRHLLCNIISNAKAQSTEESSLIVLVKEIGYPPEGLTIAFCCLAGVGVLAALWGFVFLQRRKSADLK